MAAGWVKSLQCKSRALDDVVHHYTTSKHNLLPASSSCRRSVQSLKDVIDTTKQQKPRKNPRRSESSPPSRQPSSRKSDSSPNPSSRFRDGSSARQSRSSDPSLPALSELPEGHPSRNVVEIIFHTSWSPKAFSGTVEMVFKVQNLPRTVTRFEEYRDMVKTRAATSGGGGEDHTRCLADGNEVMRFHCLGPTAGGPGPGYDCGGTWSLSGVKGAVPICTFSGSGGAHESAGGGRGRRAMLVCRVIAGRVGKGWGWSICWKNGSGLTQ
ncbi:hypothetical protein NMG60_11027288 [Bertholletia excelsa]